MSDLDRPLFIVIRRDAMVSDTAAPDEAVPAFGTAADAQAYARGIADQQSENLSAFKVAEFRFNGAITDVRC
jgi:hypothetical protein